VNAHRLFRGSRRLLLATYMSLAGWSAVTAQAQPLGPPDVSPPNVTSPRSMPAVSFGANSSPDVATPPAIQQAAQVPIGEKPIVEKPLPETLPALPALPAFGSPGCASCGSGGCGSGGCGICYPGRSNSCCWCDSSTVLGKCFCGIYQTICCPDPCYEPTWIPEANAAFFTDPVRPITQTRIRWNSAANFTFPDTAEYFWARADGKGRGPNAIGNSLEYNALALYTEIAPNPKFSLFFEIPYMAVAPANNPNTPPASGFSDMNVGTKSVLFDSELFVLAMQFRTYLPVGNANRGLGTGHVSLEPSLLAYLKLTASTYLQGQLAEWVPLGGDQAYQGSILHYSASVNQVLCRCTPDMPLIGMVEFTGYSFQAGAYTDPMLGTLSAGGGSYLTLGPGIRLSVCNRLDFGVGAAYGLTQHGPGSTYRTEVRLRF
jgi:hypothetical protein